MKLDLHPDLGAVAELSEAIYDTSQHAPRRGGHQLALVIHEITDNMTRALAPGQLPEAVQVRDGEEVRKATAQSAWRRPALTSPAISQASAALQNAKPAV
jgi:microcompartment protein CcmL/EutN